VKQKNLFTILNFVGDPNCTFGLFCLASFSIERRMKEMLLENTQRRNRCFTKKLSKQYIVYCVVGFLIAVFPTYYLLNKWLENFAYKLTFQSIHLLLAIVLLSLTLLIVLLRAFQATSRCFTILKIR
jgi:putative ABC transport system permease protein